MSSGAPIRLLPVILALVASTLYVTAYLAQEPAAGTCSDRLVGFSQCLSYVSISPNNISLSPSSRCCEVFSMALAAGEANCLCYLVRRPLILGFPLNLTRLFSLTSLCPMGNGRSEANGSFETLCSALTPLPPLQGIIVPDGSKTHDSGPESSPPSSLITTVDTSPPEPPNISAITPGSSFMPAVFSSAENQGSNLGSWPLVALMILLVPAFYGSFCYAHN